MNWSDWFAYDESSPSYLRWKVDRTSGRHGNRTHVKAGDVAGSLNSRGYFQIRTKLPGSDRVTCLLNHRIIWELFNGEIVDGLNVDHIDGVRDNNGIANLRAVSRAVNTRNAKMRSDNRSGKTGVARTCNGQGSFYWTGRCEGLDKSIFQKRFPVKLYGEDQAFQLACLWRDETLEKLNAEGAGYTDRHGQENIDEHRTKRNHHHPIATQRCLQ